MAVILSMTYQKKLGLPNFSSHSCSVSLTVEIPDVNGAAQESTKLYALLQAAIWEPAPAATLAGSGRQLYRYSTTYVTGNGASSSVRRNALAAAARISPRASCIAVS